MTHTWKDVERKVANLLGGARIPLSGRNNMGQVGDVDLVGFDIEVKSGRQVPMAVVGWLHVIRELARVEGEGKLPVLVMQPKGSPGRIVVLDLDDFARILRALRGE